MTSSFLSPACSRAADDEFAARCGELASAAKDAGKRAVRGQDEDWFFLTRELQHLATGEFWTRNWEEIALNQQDPVPFILHFHGLLKEKGIELILAPVPAKAAIYPEKLVAGAKPGDAPSMVPFLESLRQQGVNVLDLETAFRELSVGGSEKLYCEQDTHWSPLACEIVAARLQALFEGKEWVGAAKSAEEREFARAEPRELEIRGDLVDDDDAASVGREVLQVRYAGVEQGGRIDKVSPETDSPVLLLGDSHTLVFQEGASNGLHCDRAGLIDQLQYALGFPIDLVGVRGSGSAEARRSLFRHAAGSPGYWDGKKAVIWCFSAREFTQSPDKLLEIPLERGG